MPRLFVDLLSLTGSKGGMEVYIRELYGALAREAPHLDLVGYFSLEGAELGTDWFPGTVLASGISGENRVRWAAGELGSVARRARAEKADLIHSPATLGPHRGATPTVVTMHDMLYWSHPEFMSTPLYTTPVKLMERIVSRRADRVITISEGSAREIEKYLRVPRSRIEVIPLAGRPLPGVVRGGEPSDPPLVLATGNRRPHKNWPTLLRALALIPDARRPRLAITGSGPDDPLRPLVTELGLSGSVDLHGWLTEDELAGLYSRATVLTMPSFCEGFSLTPLEAMLSGIPTVVSDIDVHREVLGDASAYADPGDPARFATVLERTVHDPARLAELSRLGLERAAGYSWSRTARATAAVFDEVLTENSRRR